MRHASRCVCEGNLQRGLPEEGYATFRVWCIPSLGPESREAALVHIMACAALLPVPRPPCWAEPSETVSKAGPPSGCFCRPSDDNCLIQQREDKASSPTVCTLVRQDQPHPTSCGATPLCVDRAGRRLSLDEFANTL